MTLRFKTTFMDAPPRRKCGDCTLCCRLVPVVELGKKAGARCEHQRHSKGCRIYADRPHSCVMWSCRWLVDDEVNGLPRPDRSHYVIDIMPDYVTLTQEDGTVFEIPVVQVWVDPQYRDAWRAPEMRLYMARMADRHGMATIIRWSSSEALTVFPPAISSDREWHEMSGLIEARTAIERQVLIQDRA